MMEGVCDQMLLTVEGRLRSRRAAPEDSGKKPIHIIGDRVISYLSAELWQLLNVTRSLPIGASLMQTMAQRFDCDDDFDGTTMADDTGGTFTTR